MSDIESQSPDNTGARQRNCSNCKRPCKGHDGPYGKDCKMDILENPSGGIESTGTREDMENTDIIPRDAIGERFMGQLLIQMTKLNVTMETLVHGQNDLKSLVAGQHMVASGARQPGVTDAPRSNDSHDHEEASSARHSAVTISTHHTSNDASENQAADQDSYTILPNGNRIDNKVIRSAKKGEFVNLAEFLPLLDTPKHMEIEPVVDREGKVIFRNKKTDQNPGYIQ